MATRLTERKESTMDQRITGNSLRLYETHRRGNGADGDRKLRVFENDMKQRQDSKDISRWIKLKTEPMKRVNQKRRKKKCSALSVLCL